MQPGETWVDSPAHRHGGKSEVDRPQTTEGKGGKSEGEGVIDTATPQTTTDSRWTIGHTPIRNGRPRHRKSHLNTTQPHVNQRRQGNARIRSKPAIKGAVRYRETNGRKGGAWLTTCAKGSGCKVPRLFIQSGLSMREGQRPKFPRRYGRKYRHDTASAANTLIKT